MNDYDDDDNYDYNYYQKSTITTTSTTTTRTEYRPMEIASHPWSKSSPSAELVLVRLACLPSTASSDW